MGQTKRNRRVVNSSAIRLSSATRYLVGSDAGSARDLQERNILLQINRRKHKSERNFKKAQKAHACSNTEIARMYMRQALEYGAKAYWWSENTRYQDELHQYIHIIAKWNHDNLGCFIEFEDGKYVQRCMIAYSHKRMGVSPGMYGDKICSLCDEDLAVCPHRQDRTYWIRGGNKNERGECRICLRRKCEHSSKYLYRTQVIAHVTNPVLEEVSLVKYPVQPEMRVVSEFNYTVYEMMKKVGYKLKTGSRLLCHLCGGTCPGFDEFEAPRPSSL